MMKWKKNSLLILLSIFLIFVSINALNQPTLEQGTLLKGTDENYVLHAGASPNLAWESNGTIIANSSANQLYPELCYDGEGGVIIAMTDNLDIHVQRLNSEGYRLWSYDGIEVCTAVNFQSEVQLCSDGDGGAIIVWEDERDGASDIYAQRVDSGGHIKWTANGVVICNESNEQTYPQIINDGLGGAFIVWDDDRAGAANSDIYAQRVNSNGVVQWTLNGSPICTRSSGQNYPQICSDGAGGAIITWEDGSSGANISVQRIDANGNSQWVANGKQICTASSTQSRPKICSDGVGGAIITWADYRNGLDWDMYAQRVNAAGEVQWTPNGVEISTALGSQYESFICSDGDGGAIISWLDLRYGTDEDIYAQKIDSNGVIKWTKHGLAICTENDRQYSPEACSDGAGGAIIIWADERYGSNEDDVRAQRINSDGDAQWGSDGVIVCNAIFDQFFNHLVSDEKGGAFIVWQDERNTTRDVMAQYIRNDEPTSNQPAPIVTSMTGSETINWTLCDDFAPGLYRVWANDSNGNYYVWRKWTPWSNNTPLNVPINRNAAGTYNYTIEFHDDQNQYGISVTILVIIIADGTTIPEQPQGIYLVQQNAGNPSDLLLSPIFLGIVGAIIAAIIISTLVIFRKIDKTSMMKAEAKKSLDKQKG